MIAYFGIGAGFLIILAAFALAFREKTSLLHVAIIVVGAALASVSGFTMKTDATGLDVTFVRQVAQQTSVANDQGAAIAKLSDRVSGIEDQNAQTLAALKALSNTQQQLVQTSAAPVSAPAAPALIQGLDQRQPAIAEKRLNFNNAFLRMKESTVQLNALSKAGPPGS